MGDERRGNKSSGEWVMGCCQEGCMSELFVKNCGYRLVTPEGNTPCVWCAAIPVIGPEDFQGDRPSVQAEMGGCGCGSASIIDLAMLTYLSGLEAADDEHKAWDAVNRRAGRLVFPPTSWYAQRVHKWPYGLTETECYLIATIADTLGYTDHGGSIFGAWLDDNGREALANLRALAAVEATDA